MLLIRSMPCLPGFTEGSALEEITVEGATDGYVELFHRYGVDYIFSSPVLKKR
jgi:hypothetical protein